MISALSRPVLAMAVLSPVVILAALAGGWPGLILAAVFASLVIAVMLDERR